MNHIARMLLLGVTFGFLASSRSGQLQVNSRSCTHAGVFLVEGEDHSLSLPVAQKVCEQRDATMASPEQVKEAYAKDMEINNGSYAILRHAPRKLCREQETGFLVFPPDAADELFDAYCFRHGVQ